MTPQTTTIYDAMIPYKDLIVPVAVLLTAVIVAFFSKPFNEKERIKRIRIKLLEKLKFKISFDLSRMLPVKKEDATDEDYLAQVKEKVDEYYVDEDTAVYGIATSELVYARYLFLYCVLKYASVILSFIIVFMFFLIKNIFILLIPLALFWVIYIALEYKKDMYDRICDKNEVVDDK